MIWFGWLTKPELEVSVLDRLICFGEFLVALAAASVFFYWLEERRMSRIRKRHGPQCLCPPCIQWRCR